MVYSFFSWLCPCVSGLSVDYWIPSAQSYVYYARRKTFNPSVQFYHTLKKSQHEIDNKTS